MYMRPYVCLWACVIVYMFMRKSTVQYFVKRKFIAALKALCVIAGCTITKGKIYSLYML